MSDSNTIDTDDINHNEGNVISLSITEEISAGDIDPANVNHYLVPGSKKGSYLIDTDIDHPIVISVSTRISKRDQKLFQSPDLDWTDEYNWARKVTAVETHAFDEEQGITILEYPIREVSKSCTDAIKFLAESMKFSISAKRTDAFSISSSIAWAHTMWRYMADSFKIASSVARTISIVRTEKITILDSLRRNNLGVISDVIFEKGTWTKETIQEASRNGRHAGFGEWEPFINGNHSYSSAMFRTTIDTYGSELGLLQEFNILVDVKDVNDRGAYSITDVTGETFVRFNKTFLIEPEVIVTLRTGSSSTSTYVPIVGEVTLEGFNVKIIDLKTDAISKGSISWIAHGY